LEHISVHRYFMGIDLARPTGWQEAVEHWYDAVYLPVARAIRQHDLLEGFPGRTEADMYLFLSEHRGKLQREFGWSIGGPLLAEGLAARRIADLEERADLLTSKESVATILNSVLLVLPGDRSDDAVLRHGLTLARSEGAVAFGLLLEERFEEAAQEYSLSARQRFEAACEEYAVEGQFAVSEADSLREAVREVQARARFADVLVLPVMGKVAGALLRRSPKPLVLATAAEAGMNRPLLAYDAGAKANEALFALAYLSVSRGLKPVILHVERRAAGVDLTPEPGRAEAGATLPRGKVEESALARAGAYLARLGVKSDLVSAHGPVADTIVKVARQHGCDAIFLGSHSRLRWLEEMLGGVLDELIQRTELPLVVT
ncbi:MAG: universal stress protein, partial [Trueperaceae bacterium]